jgi:hypothetical protein
MLSSISRTTSNRPWESSRLKEKAQRQYWETRREFVEREGDCAIVWNISPLLCPFQMLTIYIYRRGGVESGVLGEITSLPLSVLIWFKTVGALTFWAFTHGQVLWLLYSVNVCNGSCSKATTWTLVDLQLEVEVKEKPSKFCSTPSAGKACVQPGASILGLKTRSMTVGPSGASLNFGELRRRLTKEG